MSSTAVGRGRLDDAPLSSLSYNYYAVSILARFPPRELGMADGGKNNGGDEKTTTPAVPPLLSATSAYNQMMA